MTYNAYLKYNLNWSYNLLEN